MLRLYAHWRPADPEQRRWLVRKLEENIANEELRKTFVYYLAKEFIAKQQGKEGGGKAKEE